MDEQKGAAPAADREPAAEFQNLAETIANINRSVVSEKSRVTYNCKIISFLQWLDSGRANILPDCLTETFKANAARDANGKLSRVYVKQVLTAGTASPIDFEILNAQHIQYWVTSLRRKKDGHLAGDASHNTARSAINHLFRTFGKRMSNDMEASLSNFFKGLKRTMARRLGEGAGKITVGKKPMQFELYCLLAFELLKSGHADDIFSHTFLILQWNLIARAGNICGICFNHMDFVQDAMTICFAHSKTDQEGKKPRHPRHIYANPIRPSICPFLSLGIYLLSNSFEKSPRRLFPGRSQYSRFSSALGRFINGREMQDALRVRHMEASDIATHSIRKGASSYCSSGSTACPSTAAVNLRAGWSMGNVTARYIHHEHAGDQYIGRTVAGLPIHSSKFKILPPAFVNNDEEVVRAVKLCFNGAPTAILRILEKILASVVYHTEFLRQHLPHDHKIFSHPLFTTDLVSRLRPKVICRMPNDTDDVQPTGVPPHVFLIDDVKAINKKLDSLPGVVERVVPAVTSGVRETLEDLAVGAGTVTSHGLATAITGVIQATGMPEKLDRLMQCLNGSSHTNQNANAGPSSTTVSSAPPRPPAFFWEHDQSYHRLPYDFSLPDGGALNAFHLYILGDRSKGFPPFRTVKPSDIGNPKVRKRLSDFKYLMRKIEKCVRDQQLWIENPTEVEVQRMFNVGAPAIALPETTVADRQRREGQLKWSTIVRNLRELHPQNKRRRVESVGANIPRESNASSSHADRMNMDIDG